MDEWTTYTGRLLWAMRHAGMTNQSELARAVGITPQSIQYLCRPASGAQGSTHTAALARALGVSSAWLARQEGLPDAEEQIGAWLTDSGVGTYALGPDMAAPVTGSLRVSGVGDAELIKLPPGEADGHVLMPVHAKGSHALRIKGNALAPYVKDGQYLLLQPGGILYAEENVVLTLKDGRCLIREVMHRKTDTLVVLPIHGGQPEALEWPQIAEVVPVVCAVPQSRWMAEAAER